MLTEKRVKQAEGGSHENMQVKRKGSVAEEQRWSSGVHIRIHWRVLCLRKYCLSSLMPAKHVLETRSPHLSFMLLKEYWFRELYLGLKVAASFDRNESYIKTIDGQIRCITAEFKPKGQRRLEC